MKLNIGCGNHRADGWTNVDIDATGDVKPDVRGDVTEGLPFNDGCAERIYLGHVLEHIDPERVPLALAECARLLAPGGTLCVVGPECDVADQLVADGRMTDAEHALVVHGAGRWAHDVHLWRSTRARTAEFLADTGWQYRPIDVRALGHAWPVTSLVPWQFAIVARHAAQEAAA